MELIQVDPATDPRWDKFVEEHPKGLFYHLSGWKKVLEKSFRHQRGHYLCITENDSIRAGLPVFEVKSWILGNRLVSIPFATLCDPLASSAEECRFLLDAVFNLSDRLKTSSIEIRTLSLDELSDERLGKTEAFVHHYIDLKSRPEQLKKRFHRSCVRQRIDRALNSGLQIRKAETQDDLRKFFSLYLKTRKRLCLPPQPYKYFRTIWDTFNSSGLMQLLLAFHSDTPIGGLLTFKFKNRVSAEFSVTDEMYRDHSPNHGLFWTAIEMAYIEGFEIFDFGRTSVHNEPLLLFKDRWATQKKFLPQYYHPSIDCPAANNLHDSLPYRVMTRILERSPLSMTHLIGNLCYRHLG